MPSVIDFHSFLNLYLVRLWRKVYSATYDDRPMKRIMTSRGDLQFDIDFDLYMQSVVHHIGQNGWEILSGSSQS
jgi:hypothetical protein